MSNAVDVYEVWLVEGHTCFKQELELYQVCLTRKQAREWVAQNQEPHTHYKIRMGEVA